VKKFVAGKCDSDVDGVFLSPRKAKEGQQGLRYHPLFLGWRAELPGLNEDGKEVAKDKIPRGIFEAIATEGISAQAVFAKAISA
jgi:hypothetical protein